MIDIVYVMSDIHGRLNLFNGIIKQIAFSPNDELYILGDVIDRGPDGIKLLLKIMRNKNMHMILGNHEYMMKRYFSNDGDIDTLEIWEQNGAKPTLNQFQKYASSTELRILRYINKLPVEIKITVNGHNFILCHAQPHPLSFKNNPFDSYWIDSQYISDEEFSVWQRYKFPTKFSASEEIGIIPDENFDDKIVIFGHSPVYNYSEQIPEVNVIRKEDNTINIDCGCAAIGYKNNRYKGRLACLRLDDMKEFYSETM